MPNGNGHFTYIDMIDVFPDKLRKGNITISQFTLTPAFLNAAKLSDILDYRGENLFNNPGEYVKLTDDVNGEVVMSDTEIERITCLDCLDNAHGNTLIAGLGLGMILVPLLENENCDKIVIVEKSQFIIDLVSEPLFSYIEDVLGLDYSIIEIIHEDIFKYKPSIKFDYIWLDIWNNVEYDENYFEFCLIKEHLIKNGQRDALFEGWRIGDDRLINLLDSVKPHIDHLRETEFKPIIDMQNQLLDKHKKNGMKFIEPGPSYMSLSDIETEFNKEYKQWKTTAKQLSQ